MTVHYRDDSVVVHHGDCLDVLAELPDASVDAVATDPPYSLSFMSRSWDHYATPAEFQRWCEQWARECLRIVKPGGHLLSFGGSRTWHRLAAGIEDAGFEIRDSIAWLYGSGFPKSLDVSKAIDKRRDDEEDVRRVCRWLRARIDDHPSESIRTIAERFGFHARMVEHWAARDTDSQPTLPTLTQWDRLRDLLAFDDELDAEVYRLNLRKGEPGEAWADRPIVGTVDEWADRTNYALTSRDGLRRGESTNPIAQQWEGWGTALKPAFEPIVVARKPLAGTVAANVLEHGTGALNIDACRIGDAGGARRGPADIGAHGRTNNVLGPGLDLANAAPRIDGLGRWPANVVLDERQAAELDKQSGTLKSGVMRAGTARAERNGQIYGKLRGDATTADTYGDEGGASRFFPVFRYSAKAPGAERPTVDGVAHPTVKPLDLMRWLVRLVTPPNGLVLDPFAGSGTTAEACIHEHMRCITIERESDYLPLIVARLSKPMAVGFDFGEGI